MIYKVCKPFKDSNITVCVPEGVLEHKITKITHVIRDDFNFVYSWIQFIKNF